MPVNRQALITTQSLFYRNGFRRLLTFSFVMMILILALLGLIFYQHYNRPVVKYFVTTSDGRLIEITPS